MDINLNNAVIFTDSDLDFAFIYKPLEEKQGWLLYTGFLDKHIGDYLPIEESHLEYGHPKYISNEQMLIEIRVMSNIGKEFLTWKRIKHRLELEDQFYHTYASKPTRMLECLQRGLSYQICTYFDTMKADEADEINARLKAIDEELAFRAWAEGYTIETVYHDDHDPCLGRIHYTATWNH